jgi:putative DNA primase/helicase
MSLCKAALEYASRGWWVLPLKPKGKAPLLRRGFLDASNDARRISGWWKRWPNANVGIVPGPSGLLVVDIDGPDASTEAKHLGLRIDDTLRVKTGRLGGWHLYYTKPEMPVGNCQLAHGIDVRCDKGYVVAPPSTHPNGAHYEWVPAPITSPPPRLLTLLRSGQSPPPSPQSDDPSQGPARIREGGRNTWLTSFAGGLRRYGASEVQILESLSVINQQMCEPPLGDREIKSIATSVTKYSIPAGVLPTEALSDMGNARRLAIFFGDTLKYVTGWGWLTFDGSRWTSATRGEEFQTAKATARAIEIEARSTLDEDRRKALLHWARASQSASRIRAMVDLAASETEIRLTSSDFDSDPWLLCVKNGLVDLRTNSFRPPSREALATMQCEVAYDPAAKAPLWEAVIARITDGNIELANYIRRSLGYALTGTTREQCFFVFYGTGANGKSTLLEAIVYILGDYATAADFSLLTGRPSNGPSEGIARLRGKRLVTAVEAEEGTRFNESLLKQLTGGDTITARNLYQASFSFRPSFKLFLATNYKPRIIGTDEGIWRRLRLVPFTFQIPQAERDTQLFEKLQGEAAGILNWVLEGTAEWISDGLGEAAAVVDATAEYRVEQDGFGAFIKEVCELGPAFSVNTNELYAAYAGYCAEHEIEQHGREKFGKALLRLGISKIRTSLGQYLRVGIRLKETF